MALRERGGVADESKKEELISLTSKNKKASVYNHMKFKYHQYEIDKNREKFSSKACLTAIVLCIIGGLLIVVSYVLNYILCGKELINLVYYPLVHTLWIILILFTFAKYSTFHEDHAYEYHTESTASTHLKGLLDDYIKDFENKRGWKRFCSKSTCGYCWIIVFSMFATAIFVLLLVHDVHKDIPVVAEKIYFVCSILNTVYLFLSTLILGIFTSSALYRERLLNGILVLYLATADTGIVDKGFVDSYNNDTELDPDSIIRRPYAVIPFVYDNAFNFRLKLSIALLLVIQFVGLGFLYGWIKEGNKQSIEEAELVKYALTFENLACHNLFCLLLACYYLYSSFTGKYKTYALWSMSINRENWTDFEEKKWKENDYFAKVTVAGINVTKTAFYTGISLSWIWKIFQVVLFYEEVQ